MLFPAEEAAGPPEGPVEPEAIPAATATALFAAASREELAASARRISVDVAARAVRPFAAAPPRQDTPPPVVDLTAEEPEAPEAPEAAPEPEPAVPVNPEPVITGSMALDDESKSESEDDWDLYDDEEFENEQ